MPQASNFIKKETLTQVFSYKFCEISKNTFLQNMSGWLLLTEIWLPYSFWEKKLSIIVCQVFWNRSKPENEYSSKTLDANYIWNEWIKIRFLFRNSHQRCSVRNGVRKNYAKFTGKHLCQSLYFKTSLAQAFSCEFCEISKNIFFTEHLWESASASF